MAPTASPSTCKADKTNGGPNGNMVMYDRTDKVLEIDRHSVMAIAGVPATAYEMVRVLEHSFKYYRRTQLQELSFEGKLRAVSKLLKDNVPAALSGTGAVVPVFAGYDFQQEAAKIYFYDILGAEFEGASSPARSRARSSAWPSVAKN